MYGFTGNKLDDSYAARNKPVIVRQLLYAGIRLAALLNQTFQKQYPLPAPASQDEPSATGSNASANRLQVKEYTPLEAPAHIGERVRICGRITGSRPLENGAGIIYYIAGRNRMEPDFSIVIFSSNYNRFSGNPENGLLGKSVCVTGKLQDYHGSIEIIVRSGKQLAIR